MFSKPQKKESKRVFITFTDRHGYDFPLYFRHELLTVFEGRLLFLWFTMFFKPTNFPATEILSKQYDELALQWSHVRDILWFRPRRKEVNPFRDQLFISWIWKLCVTV